MDRNDDNRALLVVSFGTSHASTRPRTAEAVETALREAFPERRFYRAWSSGMLRRKLEREEGEKVFSVEEAMEAMAADGMEDILIQPTFLLPGEEWKQMNESLSGYSDRFRTVNTGLPLLSGKDDIGVLARFLEDRYPRADGEMTVIMGHGSPSLDLPVYEMLQERLIQDGRGDFLLGTVEFDPGIEPVLERVRDDRPGLVRLVPVLLTVGEHVLNDMAGDDPDSWKNRIAAEGPETQCCLTGLGEYPEMRELYVRHAAAAAEGKN